MRRALTPILFQDETVFEDSQTRDAVAKPEPSPSVKAKKRSKQTPEGLPAHSFSTLLPDLATLARVRYRVGNAETIFDQLSTPSPRHQRVFDLLGV
jgi:hypothetical protein